MTDTMRPDSAPPRHEADAGARVESTPHTVVRASQPLPTQGPLPVRHLWRLPEQPNAAEDDIPYRADSCSPEASLLDILETVTSTTATHPAASPSAALDDPPPHPIEDQLRAFNQELPTGVAGDLPLDGDRLADNLKWLITYPEWRRR